MAVRQIIVRGRVVDVQHREPVRGVVVEFVAYVEGGRAQPIGTATTLGTGFFVVRVASVSENLRAEHFGLRVFDAATIGSAGWVSASVVQWYNTSLASTRPRLDSQLMHVLVDLL